MADTIVTGKEANSRGPVLVAVDFAPDSEAAVVWGAIHAACIKVPLVILHVIHDPAEAPGFYRKEEQDWSKPMADIAEQMMADFMTTMRSKHSELEPLTDAKTVLVSGLPPSRIIEIGKLEDAQLIVVGSRGNTGLPHVLLGSVAERVAQTSAVPVIIIKNRQQESDQI